MFIKIWSTFGICLVFLTAWIAFLIPLYFYFKYKANYWQRRGVKGPKALPLIGNVWEQMFTPQNILEEQRLLKYGRIYGTLQGWKPVITVAEPELVKQMLVSDFPVFMDHTQYFTGDPMFSTMLGELNGDEWRRMRAILSPTFTTSKLKSMYPLIEKCALNTMKYFESVAAKEGEFDAKVVCLSFTMDVIASCVFGVETNSYEDPTNEFIIKARDMTNLKIWRVLCSLCLPRKIREMFDLHFFSSKLSMYFTAVLKNTINKRREMKTQQRNDFVTLLLNAQMKEDSTEKEYNCNVSSKKKKLSETELIAQCFVFFFAGYDQTSTSLNFFLYSMAMYPDIQKRLYEEVHAFMKSDESDDFEKLNALPYLEAVLCETLRRYTPASIVEHVCTKDYELGDTGITIEKGTVYAIPFAAMHNDPESFPNPHEFNPERFMPENRHNIQPYTFIPYGIGPRICIGDRFANVMMKYFLANFINSFEVIKTKNTVSSPQFTGKYGLIRCAPLLLSVKQRL